MSKFGYLAGLFLVSGLIQSPARADLYGAQQAYKKQDFAQAFTLYREIAELGHPFGQETLALMYVTGEGVKRDNVLGYGWAVIARENGTIVHLEILPGTVAEYFEAVARAAVIPA